MRSLGPEVGCFVLRIVLTIERTCVGDIIHQQDALSSTPIEFGDRPEPRLSGCQIPLGKKHTYKQGSNQKTTSAIRTTCNLIRVPSISIVRIMKSTPILPTKDVVQGSPQNLRMRHDFPTPVARVSALSLEEFGSWSTYQSLQRAKAAVEDIHFVSGHDHSTYNEFGRALIRQS